MREVAASLRIIEGRHVVSAVSGGQLKRQLAGLISDSEATTYMPSLQYNPLVPSHIRRPPSMFSLMSESLSWV